MREPRGVTGLPWEREGRGGRGYLGDVGPLDRRPGPPGRRERGIFGLDVESDAGRGEKADDRAVLAAVVGAPTVRKVEVRVAGDDDRVIHVQSQRVGSSVCVRQAPAECPSHCCAVAVNIDRGDEHRLLTAAAAKCSSG